MAEVREHQAVLLHGVVDHRALHHVFERADMQAIAQGLLGLRPLAGLALDLLELEIEAVAHLLDRNRGAAQPAIERDMGAADMGHLAAAPAHPQHVADAPQPEADDQHTEHQEQDDEAGVFAELVHCDGTGKITGRMPTTGPPCRQRGRPLDTEASKR